jgi:hypothetical protein
MGFGLGVEFLDDASRVRQITRPGCRSPSPCAMFFMCITQPPRIGMACP